MSNFLKIFWLLTLFSICFFTGLIIGFNVDAATLTNEQAIIVEKIKSREDDILYSEQKTENIFDGQKIISSRNVVDYAYKYTEVDSSNIIFTDNNKYSNTEKINNNSFKIYTEPKYYKNDNGQVQEIITERVSDKIWLETLIPTTLEKIQALLKTPYAIADSYFPSSDDSMYSSCDGSNWSACHSATSGGALRNTTWELVQATSDFYLERAFLNFDTSSIGSGYTVSSSSLYLYGMAKADNGIREYNIYSSTAGNTISLDDFDAVGSTAFSTGISQANWSISGYNIFNFNNDGKAAVNMTGISKFSVRESTKDVANVEPTDRAQIQFYSSRQTGTGNDPYLIIEIQETEPEQPTGTTTIDLYPCEIPENTDIGVITGCKNIYNGTTSSSTITAIEYYYYKIPFILYLFIFSLLSICLSIIYAAKKSSKN